MVFSPIRHTGVKLVVAAVLALVIAVGAAGVTYWRGSNTSHNSVSAVPAGAERVQPFISRLDNGTVELSPSIDDGSPAGFSPGQLKDLRAGLGVYNQRIQAGDAGVDDSEADSG